MPTVIENALIAWGYAAFLGFVVVALVAALTYAEGR